jgi:hypothetical protein
MKKISALIVLLTLIIVAPVIAEEWSYDYYMTYKWNDGGIEQVEAIGIYASSYKDVKCYAGKTMKLKGDLDKGDIYDGYIYDVQLHTQRPDRSIYPHLNHASVWHTTCDTFDYNSVSQDGDKKKKNSDTEPEWQEGTQEKEDDPNSFESLYQKYRNEVTEEDIMNTMSKEKREEFLRLKRLLEFKDFRETIKGNIALYRQDRLRREAEAKIEAELAEKAKKEAKERVEQELAEKKEKERKKPRFYRPLDEEDEEESTVNETYAPGIFDAYDEKEIRYCAHIYAEFDNEKIQLDIWAWSDNQARCMVEAVMESFPAADGGYDLFYGGCVDPSGDKIYSEGYPGCIGL